MASDGGFLGLFTRKYPRIHWQRIESPGTGCGIPDLYFCSRGFSAWAEAKYINKFPKRSTTLLKIDHYTDDQKLWLKNHMDAGGHSLMVLGIEKSLLIERGYVIKSRNKIITFWYYGWDALKVGSMTVQKTLSVGETDLLKIIARHNKCEN